MPELPEVETVRRSLERLIAGQTIVTVQVREPRLRKPVTGNFAAALRGRTIRAVGRRGKYLRMRLDDDLVWLVHLGMTGQLIVGDPDIPLRTHDHIVMTLGDGRSLRYHDPRRFGLMAVGPDTDIEAMMALGVEPLEAAFSAGYLQAKAQATRRSIKDVLLDQRVVAGIGNIYASELLFRAKVQPGRVATTLRPEEVARVVKAGKATLREAIAHRGSSISDYRDGAGQPGDFQHRFRVYDRAGQPCRACGTVIEREIHGGRSSFFCPSCQV